MREDLKKLLISEQEMYALNGSGDVLDALREYRNSFSRGIDRMLRIGALLSGLGMSVVGAILIIVFLSHSTSSSEPTLAVGLSLLVGSAIPFGLRMIDFHGRFILRKYGRDAYARYCNYLHPEPMQRKLFQEVERFNKLVRAIHVSDEIDAAGVEGARLQDRGAVLRGMAIARTDLVRALKLERIMRENADVSNAEFQLFNVDLTHLAAMQVEDAATQQGKLMNEAFQIARSVQIEVRKLQTNDSQKV